MYTLGCPPRRGGGTCPQAGDGIGGSNVRRPGLPWRQVYTAEDYTSIVEYLIQKWNVENITGLTKEAQVPHVFPPTFFHLLIFFYTH